METQAEQEREIRVYLGQTYRRAWITFLCWPIIGLVMVIVVLTRDWSWLIRLPILDPTHLTIALILSGIGSVSALLAWRGFHKTIVLVVNRDGFSFGESHTIGRFLLPWSEIEAIYLANKHLASLFCLSLRLRDLPHFRTRLNPLQRLSVRKKPGRTGTPINLQQLVLSMPLEELLSQIIERFADELNHYEVRLSREA